MLPINKTLDHQINSTHLITELDEENAAYYTGGFQIEYGTTPVGISNSRSKDVLVDYPNFPSEPSFVALPEFAEPRNPNWNDAFSVTILDKNSFWARVRVQREDATGGWGQNLKLSWIAVG